MFKPKYSLSPKLVANITAIERLCGRLEGWRLPPELELNLTRNNLIKSSYISNSIEGNPLSLPEVTNLLLGDRLPVNRDEKEVQNYFNILKNLSTYLEQPFSLSVVKNIHQQLLQGVNDQIAGKVRDTRVVVGRYISQDGHKKLEVKHEPPWHQKELIEAGIKDLVDWLETDKNTPVIVKAGIFHHQFVFIHPFIDGNGRTCRLLTALLFLKHQYLINKYFVLDDYYDIDRLQYSQKLGSADKGDKTEWLEYFSDGVNYSLQSALGRVKDALGTVKVVDRPTAKEKAVLNLFQELKEMTSTDLVQKLTISRQQAHNLLSGLLAKGFLVKKGKTKSAYYYLK